MKPTLTNISLEQKMIGSEGSVSIPGFRIGNYTNLLKNKVSSVVDFHPNILPWRLIELKTN